MAASSSSFRTCEAKYHVFLSFRGEDTRHNFISYLYRDLYEGKGVETFIDCNDIQKGENISGSLLKAIEESQIAIIVFSKGYASSTWCLEELAKIMACAESGGLNVLPVFYHVDPSDVRKQSGTFEAAFANHEERFREELWKVEKWRSALTKAADLNGFHIEVTSPEAELEEKIVTHVLEILNHESATNKNGLVGVESIIEEIKYLLDLTSNGVFTIGIWGMGGIGKTTLAAAVFEEIKSQFGISHFEKNVEEESLKTGFLSMRKNLLSKLLKDDAATLKSVSIERRLPCKKILLVLDDVTNPRQKDELIGNLNQYFGSGSRMIITSRDKEVLQYFGVKEDKIYNVESLSDIQGLALFSLSAFKKEYPEKDYEELSEWIATRTIVKGVPSAIKSIGFKLLTKSKEEWEDEINELGGNSIQDVMDMLQKSYDRLSLNEKNIFLDIAYFYNGLVQPVLEEILKDNGFVSNYAVRNLIKKSLIMVVDNLIISMHDLLQEMGRNIHKRSRLRSHEEIDFVLRNNRASEEIEVIQLDISKISIKIKLEPDTFFKMPYLRSLDLFPSPNSDFWCPWRWRWRLPYEENEKEVLTCEGLEFVCSKLRWLRWFKYPLKSLPSRFDPRNLVVLIMPFSHIEQLGNDDQKFVKLKHIDLSHSKQLTKIEDLSTCLETLILEGCSSLTELAPCLQRLGKLIVLNLKDCQSLSNLPTSLESQSLGEVILSGTAIEKLPSIESSRLRVLELDNCSRLESLPSTICKSSLLFLHLSVCSKPKRLLSDFLSIKYLNYFEENYTAMRELPSSITRLNNLQRLYLRGCNGQGLLDSSLSSLSGLKSLWRLHLSDCEISKLPCSLGELPFVAVLDLSEKKFECIPAKICKDLPNLKCLYVSNCEMLRSLPMLPRVSQLQADDCTSLKSLPDLSFFGAQKIINFANCFKLDRNELEAKVQNALLELQSKAPPLRSHRGAIFYPGNKIPEFFSFQEVGSSITLRLPVDFMKAKRFGVEFIPCVVLKFRHDHTIDGRLRVRYMCMMEGKDGKIRHELLRFYDYSKADYSFPRWTIKSSDHVFLWYRFNRVHGGVPIMIDGSDEFDVEESETWLPVKWEERDNGKNVGSFDRVTFHFYVDGCEDIQVKRCGIQLLLIEEEEGGGELRTKRLKFSNSSSTTHSTLRCLFD